MTYGEFIFWLKAQGVHEDEEIGYIDFTDRPEDVNRDPSSNRVSIS